MRKISGLNAARRGSKTTLLFKGTTGLLLQLGPQKPTSRRDGDAQRGKRRRGDLGRAIVPRGWGWAGGSCCSMPCPGGAGGFQSTAHYTPLPPTPPASFGHARRSVFSSSIVCQEQSAQFHQSLLPLQGAAHRAGVCRAPGRRASCPTAALPFPAAPQAPTLTAVAPIPAPSAAGLAWPRQPPAASQHWGFLALLPLGPFRICPTAGIWEAGGFGEGSAADVPSGGVPGHGPSPLPAALHCHGVPGARPSCSSIPSPAHRL